MTDKEEWNKFMTYKGLAGKTVGTSEWHKLYREYVEWEKSNYEYDIIEEITENKPDKVNVLIEALEFYADKKTYEYEYYFSDEPYKHPITDDEGNIARKALASYKGEDE